jgi:hypothetical protein
MENYLYFAETPCQTGGAVTGCDPEAALLPVSSYLGCDTDTTSTLFKFMSCNGTSGTTTITLSHAAGNNKFVIDAMMRIMNSYPHATGFIVAADSEVTTAGSKKAEYHPLFRGKVTGVAIVDSRSCVGG